MRRGRAYILSIERKWRYPGAIAAQYAGIAPLGKSEFFLVGGLLFLGLVSLPLVKDVYMVQNIVLAVCSGLGFQ